MTETKAALHEAVDQFEDAEAELMLETSRAKRLDALLANVEEVKSAEWDHEMIAGITPADQRETIPAAELKKELGI